MPRWFDLIAVGAVAVVVLLPKASVDARPALVGAPMELDRVAAAQDDLCHAPDDAAAALRLADELLSFGRADWAMQTLAPFASRHDHRVHLVLATAHSERLEPAEAVAECQRFDEACAAPGPKAPPCAEGEQVKAQLLRAAMQALLDAKIDPAKDPMKAKELVYKALHPAKYNLHVVPSK